jgi:hypothetical protein
MYKMSRNIIVHDVNLTGVAEPNEPASFTVRVEPGETVRAIRQKVADMARSGRINDVLYFIYAGRRLNDDDVLPADISYVAVKFAAPVAAAAAAAAAGPGAGATGGRRRRSTRRRGSKAKRGGSRRGSRRHRRSTRRSKRSGHRKH